jgi:nucleoside-diphosphate-sugar epimerase
MHLVVAGCGWLGSEIARRAAARGDRVTAIRRDLSRAGALAGAGVHLLALDLTAPDAVGRLPAADAIVACQAADGEGVEAYRSAYLAANRALLAAASARGARFVYTGSTGVFGQRDGSTVDERTPPQPAGPTAEVLAEAEAAVLAAARGGARASLLRLSGLYGPGRAGILERVRSGRLALGPGDDAWMSFCHRDDAAELALAAATRGEQGAVYHGSDAEPARRRDVVSWIAQALDIVPHRDDEPWSGPNRRIVSDRTRQSLGMTLAFPSFREGLTPLLPSAR